MRRAVTAGFLLAVPALIAGAGNWLGVSFIGPASDIGLRDLSTATTVYGLWIALLALGETVRQTMLTRRAAQEARAAVIDRLFGSEAGRAAEIVTHAAEAVRSGSTGLAESELRRARIAMGQARALAEVRSESALSSELQRLLLDVGVAESSIARATHNISSTLGTLKRVEQRLHELDVRGRVAALTGGQHGQ